MPHAARWPHTWFDYQQRLLWRLQFCAIRFDLVSNTTHRQTAGSCRRAPRALGFAPSNCLYANGRPGRRELAHLQAHASVWLTLLY